MKYKLYLYENRTLFPMGVFDSREEINAIIMRYLDEIGFKSYYQRWYSNNPMKVDFGSHTRFFYIYEV